MSFGPRRGDSASGKRRAPGANRTGLGGGGAAGGSAAGGAAGGGGSGSTSGGGGGGGGGGLPGGQPEVIFRTSLHNTVFDVMSSRPGWEETDSDTDWDINWADVAWIRDFFDHMHFDDQQRVNHFRNHYELTRKDLLVKNLKRMKRHLERTDLPEESRHYDFFPSTFVLPGEYGLFLEDFKRTPGVSWIMKPIGKAQGKGIFLFNKLSQISEWKKDHKWKAEGPQVETYVAQRYIQRPYLVGGRKFDMRLYLLVTSFSPLVCWLHRDGFCRFSSGRYTEKELGNLSMHLTNVAIQKKEDDYNADQGCKWSIRHLKQFLLAKHGKRRVAQVFYDIQMMMIRTLLAVQKTIIQDKHCFELYGYDVIIDSDLKPWLLEVNASPSLTASNDEDYALKAGLLEDVISVVDVEEKRQGTEVQVGGFDLVWNNGAVSPAPLTGDDRNRVAALAATDAALALHYPRRGQQRKDVANVQVLSQFSNQPPRQGVSYLGGYAKRTDSSAIDVMRRRRAARG
eukprot:g1226.t1